MLKRIEKALRKPQAVLPHIGYLLRAAMRALRSSPVREVVQDGRRYYRYKRRLYPEYLNRGNAASHIRDKALHYCQGTGIDVGSSEWPLPGAIPIENEQGQNAYELDAFKDNSLDYVFSSHCLEHLERWKDALALWITKLKPGGVLFLYLPHRSMKLWRRGAPWVGDQHKWVPAARPINSFLAAHGMHVVEYTDQPDTYWSFHVIARKA